VSASPKLPRPATRGRSRARGLRAQVTLCGLAALLGTSHARALDEADRKKAEAMFDEGRKLMMEPGKLDEGCATLAKSYALHERGDTLLNLAECHSRQGKTATAWREFDQAIRIGASFKFQEAIEVAKMRRDQLAEKLSSLTVTIAPEVGALEGFTVTLDGAALDKLRWNQKENRDPGPVEVTASAKGYKPFVARVDVGADKDAKVVVVKLEKEPPPPPPPKPPPPKAPPPPPPSPAKPVWPWIVGGVGLGLVGASIGLGVDVLGAGDELDARCGPQRSACPPGYDFASVRSRELTNFGLFVGLGAGGLVALGAAGLGLGLSGSSGPAKSSTPKTSLHLSPTSAYVQGSF
jgi:hypothetical protein